MPIYLNYSSGSAIPNSVQFGNVYIANDDLQSSHSYGPTSITNWYTGIDYPNGGYTWYRYTTGSGAPVLNIWVPSDDIELLTYYNRVQGTTYVRSTEVKDEIDNDPNQYLDGEPDRDGMVLYYDFSNPATYVGSGSIVEDQSGEGNDGELINSPTFNSTPPYFTGFTSNQYIGVTNASWSGSIPTGNSDRTILIAFRTPNAFTVNYYHALHYGTNAQDDAYGFAVWTNGGNGGIGNSNADGVLANHTWNGTFYADFALALNTDYVGVIRYRDTDSPRSSMWVNGSFKTIGFGQGKTADYSIDTGTTFAPRIGNRISTPLEPLGTNGRVYSVLFYDRYLSDNECNTIGEIIAKRHNISF